MDDMPSFRHLYEIAQNEGTYVMQKCVIEHFEKIPTWRKVGAPLPNHPILADHVIAYGKYGDDDGKYHPEYLYRGRASNIKSQPLRNNFIEIGTDGQRYRIPSMVIPFLNLSRRNSGFIRGSNGFIDKRVRPDMRAAQYNGDYGIDNNDIRGFSAKINPKTHRVFHTVDDWIKFAKEHPVSVKWDSGNPKDPKLSRLEDWQFPDFDTYPGVHSIEWSKAFFDDLDKEESRKKLADNKVGIIYDQLDEPQIAILHPDAIMSTEPYRWDENVNRNSYEKHKDDMF